MTEGQPPRHRHRWPAKQTSTPPRPRPADVETAAIKAIGDLTNAVLSLAPVVLDSSTFQLDANGQATRQFRVPFAAVAVTSGSVARLTIASGPPGAAAPGPSAGAGHVPPLGFAAHNISGRVWTIYGGSAGDLVTVTTFGRPVPPSADPGITTAHATGTAAVAVSAAGATAAATLPAGVSAGGFSVSFGNFSVANTVVGTLTGAAGGTQTFEFVLSPGALPPALFAVNFPAPIPPAAPGGQIALTLPGNINSPPFAVNLYGVLP